MPDRLVIVDDIRVRGTAKAFSHQPKSLPFASEPPNIEMVILDKELSSSLCFN